MNKSFTAQNKIRKVMKIGAVQGMIAMVFCGLAMANTNYGQVLERKVTLTIKDASAEEVFKAIEEEAHVRFFYSIDQLELNDKLSVYVNDRPLKQVLDELLSPYNINYKVYEKEGTVILKRTTHANRLTKGSESLKHLVSGTITESAKKQGMPGVNILIKGTLIGTTSDADGRYQIPCNESDILTFSFIGYKSLEEQVGERTVIDIEMEEDVASLGEVVVNAGYWKVSDRDRTGNIGRVTDKEIQDQPVGNALAALQGRVAGLDVTQMTGVPGGNFKVRIRGTNSIENGNDPLYIIDGVPFTSTPLTFNETAGSILGNSNPIASAGSSPLNAINPSDIQSIEILKDADATAVYGSRGANGVILITTKQGVPGKTKVNFNFYNGVGNLTRKVNQLSTPQYLSMRHEAFKNDGISPTAANAPDLLVWDTTRYTDWQKKLIGGTAHSTDAQLSFNGGDKQTQFSFGGGYHRETTVFPGSNSDQRFSSRVSITNSSLNQKFKSAFSINYSVTNSTLPGTDLTMKALTTAPDAPPLRDAAGNINWDGWNSTFENPIAFTKRRYKANSYNFIGSSSFSYLVLPNLIIKASVGFTSLSNKSVNTIPRSSLFPAPDTQNSASFSNSTFQNWIVEPQVNWKPKVAGYPIDVLLGGSFLSQNTEGLSQSGYGFASESLIENLASAPNKYAGTNYFSQYRYEAVFGRFNYKIKDRYILNLTARRDGSSRFGSGNQFANFGAVGAAWIFSEAQWLKDKLPAMSFGKLRASFGITGNDQLGDYSYLDSYSSSSGSYQGKIGLQPDRLSNPQFAWETNKKGEAGIEAGFFNNRIQAAVSFYQNRSSHQLVGFSLPATTGFSVIQGNFPAVVQNRGTEIQLTTKNIDNGGFSWTTSVNLTVPRNQLLKYPGIESSPYANTYVVGKPLGIVLAYEYTGVDPVKGVYTFKDVNGDGVINYLDAKTVKFVGMNFFGGIQNSIRYRNFQLDIFFQYAKQTGRSYLYTRDAVPGSLSNQPAFVLDRWRREGDHSDIQRFSTDANYNQYFELQSSTRGVTDASFVRLKNLSFSWNMPGAWSEKFRASNCQIFVRAQNLLTISNFKGLDPEVMGYLPPLRVITGGFNLTF